MPPFKGSICVLILHIAVQYIELVSQKLSCNAENTGILEFSGIVAGFFFDSLQLVLKRIGMDDEPFGGLTDGAVFLKKHFDGVYVPQNFFTGAVGENFT